MKSSNINPTLKSFLNRNKIAINFDGDLWTIFQADDFVKEKFKESFENRDIPPYDLNFRIFYANNKRDVLYLNKQIRIEFRDDTKYSSFGLLKSLEQDKEILKNKIENPEFDEKAEENVELIQARDILNIICNIRKEKYLKIPTTIEQQEVKEVEILKNKKYENFSGVVLNKPIYKIKQKYFQFKINIEGEIKLILCFEKKVFKYINLLNENDKIFLRGVNFSKKIIKMYKLDKINDEKTISKITLIDRLNVFKNRK